jgi:hypothetical protein
MTLQEQLRELARAAVHALRSYQYGNSSPDLAKECADELEALLAQLLAQLQPPALTVVTDHEHTQVPSPDLEGRFDCTCGAKDMSPNEWVDHILIPAQPRKPASSQPAIREPGEGLVERAAVWMTGFGKYLPRKFFNAEVKLLAAEFAKVAGEAQCDAAEHLYHPPENCGCTFCEFRAKVREKALKDAAQYLEGLQGNRSDLKQFLRAAAKVVRALAQSGGPK